MTFRTDDLNLSALLKTSMRNRAYILSLIRRYHSGDSLDDMTLDLELVIIRIAFLFVSFDKSGIGENLHDRPKSFSLEAGLLHCQDLLPVTYLDLDRGRHP